MTKNIIFGLLFAMSVTSCITKPSTVSDETGSYRHLTGKKYIKVGDKLTAKGYPVYKYKTYRKGDQYVNSVAKGK